MVSGMSFAKEDGMKASRTRAIQAIVLALILVPLWHLAIFHEAVEAAPSRLRLAMGIDKLMAEWDRNDSPGVAVLVTDHGRTVFRKGYGMASLEYGIPVTHETVFELASTSKQFTAAAVLLLEHDGMLSLDDDIRIYLPELPNLGEPVTIRHLLNHTSGLWDYWQVAQFAGFRRWDYLDFDDVLTLLSHQEEFCFAPGSKWSYCNSNYCLLAEIVARVTGEPFETWTAEHIFRPLGMDHTRFWADCFEVIPNLASPYLPDGDGFKSGRSADLTFAGAAHAFSTIEDMARWLDSFGTGRLAGRKFIDEMCTKGTLDTGEEIFYAAGLGVLEYRGVKTVGHSGQTGGYKSAMLYCPDLMVGVVILANVSSVNPEGLAKGVLDVYLDDRLEPVPEREEADEAPFIEIDPDIIDRYVGSYQIEGAPVIVAAMRDGDNMLGAMSGEGMAYLYPTSETVFMTGHRRFSIEFVPGASGEISRARLNVEGDEMWADRMVDALDDQEMGQYTGKYYSEALGMVYSVDADERGLRLSHRRVGEDSTILLDAGEDTFASGFGFIYFTRNDDGRVRGFSLWHEFLGDGMITFEKVGTGL
jgi:CubicO group peptidase (beta-lactamase class C family)